jgi:holo-[acyl-carrier protein] synthase
LVSSPLHPRPPAPLRIQTGVDLIEIERVQGAVQRHGKRFLERVFTAQELAEVGHSLPSLAARFAAKEAVSKALGTGIGQIGWCEVEVLRGEALQPVLRLHGAAARLAEDLGLQHWSISLSHTHTHAVAVVVALGGT